jgi:ABC-type nitrate/sulfonate/bicarbonate transport system substrate-binding protein
MTAHDARMALARLALAAALVLVAPAARAAEAVTLSVPVFNMVFAYLFVAEDKGFFAEEGIEPKIMALSGGVSTPAMIGGSLDYSSSPSSAISAILRGAALKVVFVSQSRSTERLWSFDPDVRRLEDLRGKIIAISSRGGTEELAIRMLLEAHHLPADFVGFTAMGVGSARVASLTSGQQRYATFGAVEEEALRQAGVLEHAQVIVDMTKEVEIANGGIATSDAELRQHRARTVRVLRAIWKGVRYLAERPGGAAAAMARRFPDVPRDRLARDIADAVASMNPQGAMPPEAAARELSARAALLGVPAGAIPPLTKVYDFSAIGEARAALADWHAPP